MPHPKNKEKPHQITVRLFFSLIPALIERQGLAGYSNLRQCLKNRLIAQV